MTQALLFDLDGTLIDSSDDLTRALNAAFAEHGLGALSREQVEPLIGQGAPALIERALRTSGQRHLVADSDRLLASFSQRSHEIYDLGRSSTRAHRFALEALRELKSMGVLLALVTNKGRELSVKALRKINAEPFLRQSSAATPVLGASRIRCLCSELASSWGSSYPAFAWWVIRSTMSERRAPPEFRSGAWRMDIGKA
jgi:phosphoglycolate phosphatase-like HAD superfamily hydrolase